MDGWVIVGTRLDSKQLERDLKQAERRLQQYEKEAERLTKTRTKTEIDLQPYEEAKRNIEELTQAELKSVTTEKEKSEILAIHNRTLENLNEKYSKQLNNLNEINRKIQENTKNQELMKNEIEETGNKLKQAKMKDGIEDIGNSISKTIKKVAKWALAIFSVRTAYNAIRSAMSLIESNNEGISKQIDIMKMAVANTLTPAIQKILNLVKTLMLYINYIAYRLTGKYLFDFTKAFNDVNKSSASTLKNINKITAGFDEMNVLSDTSSSSSGVGGTAVENPFENWEDWQPPKWLEKITNILEKIKNNWKPIVAGILAIGGAFLVFKLLKAKDVSQLGTSFTGFFNSLGKGVETIAILGGFALVLNQIVNLIDVFSQSGLKVSSVLGLMATIVGSLVALIIALTVASQALQSPLAMGGLVLLTASISAILLVIAETLPTILDALGKFIDKVGPTLNKMLEIIGDSIAKIIYSLGTALPPIIDSVGTLFEKVGKTIVDIFTAISDLISNTLQSILNFINKLGPAINNFVDNAISAATKLINFMVSGIEYLVNTLVIRGVNAIINGINKIGKYVGFTIPVIANFTIPRFVPRLAVGGVVNMPGRGVPVGGAIAGERGPEGVIPLTNSQMMAELGEAIGRYVNINATVPVYVGNRQIAREIKKINANNDFAFNS